MKNTATTASTARRVWTTAAYGSAVLTFHLSGMVGHACAQQRPEADARIKAAAASSYVFRTYLSHDLVRIDSNKGVVTLTGSVKELSHKQLAEDTIAALPDVKRVENKIETKDMPRENSDAGLRLKVKSLLAYHRSVNAWNTQVAVKQGTAILKGEASSQAQRDLVTEYTQDVIGIQETLNQMTITHPAKEVEHTPAIRIDDASITAQVRMVLLAHLSTHHLRPSVATQEGIVTLIGSANHDAEVDRVTELVNDIHGVKSVVNHMAVGVTSSGK